jgi:hypothetical protein
MKKYFLILFLTALLFSQCNENKQSPAENGEMTIINVSTGNPKIPASTREYTWRACGIVKEATKDSVLITLDSERSGWQLTKSFAKPINFKKGTGDTVLVTGTAWGGGYDGGWLYAIE